MRLLIPQRMGPESHQKRHTSTIGEANNGWSPANQYRNSPSAPRYKAGETLPLHDPEDHLKKNSQLYITSFFIKRTQDAMR